MLEIETADWWIRTQYTFSLICGDYIPDLETNLKQIIKNWHMIIVRPSVGTSRKICCYDIT